MLRVMRRSHFKFHTISPHSNRNTDTYCRKYIKKMSHNPMEVSESDTNVLYLKGRISVCHELSVRASGVRNVRHCVV